MKQRKKRVILTIMAVFIILTPPSVKAEYITDTKETLRGIKSILVVVKNINQEAQGYGFTKDMIQKDAASQLELAGIEVIPLKKFQTLNPYLFIEVKTVWNGLDLFAYSLLVAFKQLVYLGNNPDLSFDAITWSKMIAGTASEKELGKTARSSVKDSMDIFLNDYLSVNPKQATNPQSTIGNSPSFAVNGKRKTSIKDKKGERWDITQAVSIGFKPENFQYGLGRNAIRPLDDTFLRNDSSKALSHLRIIGISENSDAQAYSIPKLPAHEIANTTIGSEPIAAAYWPLADLAAVYSRRIDGQVLTLVPSGWTYENTFVLYDRETETLWYPYRNGLMGIQGKYFKRWLDEIPSEDTVWKKWKKKHPNTKILK